jgi:hypothetical protein
MPKPPMARPESMAKVRRAAFTEVISEFCLPLILHGYDYHCIETQKSRKGSSAERKNLSAQRHAFASAF